MARTYVLCVFIHIILVTCDPVDIKSSLTFVFDVTRSMKVVMLLVEQNAHAIFDAVMDSSEPIIENFVLVTFADPRITSKTDANKYNVVNVTTTKDRDVYKNSLIFELRHGSDCPEQCLQGIQRGIEASLPTSTIYVFTDASAYDYNKYDHIRSIALEKQIQLIFIIFGKCNFEKYPYEGYEVYNRLAKDTTGQVFNLRHKETADIIEYIKKSSSSRRTPLIASNLVPGKEHTFNYTTDHAMSDTIIAISCLPISFSIVGPDNKTVEVTNLVNLANITVMKVNETKLGVQTVTVDCESPSRLVATAKSYIQFRHGFSGFKPVSLNDTTVEPSPYGKTYLLIQVKGNFKPEFVRLLDASNNLIPGQILPLSALDDSKKLFLTEPFKPPYSLFRIVVFGINLDHNETLYRINTFLVKLQSFTETPKDTKPTVTIENNPSITVEIGTAIQLKCLVTAYPKPTITWDKNGVIIETQVYDFKLPYEYVSVYKIEKADENATYTCKASNEIGNDSDDITVRAENKIFFNITEKPDIMNHVLYNTDAKFACKVDAYPPAHVKWYKNGNVLMKDDKSLSSDGYELTIKQMQPSDEGNYACEFKNSYHNTIHSFEVKISGVVKPKIEAMSTRLSTTEGSDIDISCRIEEGIPKPTIRWLYQDTTSSDFNEVEGSSDQEILSLKNVQRNNSGTYKCIATNFVDSDAMEFNLIVKYAPAVDDESAPVSVKAGAEVTLACSADGVPEPDVEWRKDNTTLSDPKFVSKSDHSLVFDADLEDSGDYECLATNELGTDSKTVSVEVLKQPTALINETDPIDAEYDEPLNITCEVLGYPKPDIVWTDVTNAAELEADVDEISHYRFISRLHIEKVTANAKYQCKANNTLGDGRHEVSVKTERKPHFNVSQNPEDKTYDIAYTTTTDFHCEADAYPAAEVNWYKNDRVLVSNENISVSSDGLVLTIKQMQLSDEGHYTCKVHNAYNSHEFPFEVRISGVAKPIISATSTEQNATESSDINFSCRIEQGIPKPTIRWLYQDTTSSDFNEVEGTSDQEVLSLKNVQRNNSGTYKCIATNFVDSDTVEFNLIVKYAPAVDDESAPVSVKTGAEVTLACSADGVPEPDVEWRKDNTTLSDPKFVSKSDHSLVFDADLEDSGDYECLATNELGTDSKTVSVEVLKQPTALINETDPIDAEYDEPLNITCEVLGYPKPDIVWTDVTNAAELEADVDEISHYRFISRLHIEKVTANAKYQCKANNTLGDGRHEVSVKTERKPHFNMSQNPEDKTYDIAYTTTTDFHCEADAYPAAEVNWYKNDRVLVSNENISVSSDGLVLTIKQMQLSDEGHYTCKVHNAYNSHEFPFEVRISGVAKPIISATSTEQNATESSDINFSCRIEQGIPKPTIRWLYQDTTSSDFNEVEGTSDQEVLSLKNVQRNNSGTYKCIATNFVDSDTMEFNLIVKYAPAVDDESAPVSVKTGAEVTLACSADGVHEPDVEWRKDNTTLSDPKFVSKSDHSLVFDAALEDSGDYECLATNELGTDSKTISVEVLKQPTALINETDPIDAEYDEPLNITCEVLGYPKPDIVWTDVTNAAELEADVDEISHYRFISRLHIEKVTANAKYQCKANNTLGDGRHEVSVKTERKPHFNMSQNPEDKTYDIAYTTTTDFHCEADAYPAAEVNWYKNDRVLVSNENISVSSDGLVLTIKQMQLSDEGHYTCKVHNAYNSHEFPFEVRISGVAKPIISATSTEQNATESSDINFSCRIEQGIPKPTIRWLYQDTTSSDFNEVEGTSDQEVLSLKNVQRNNSGTYKCIATNFVDSDTVEFNLIVKYAPAVDDESAPVSVKTGAEVTLACSADGVPEPDVEWRKDNTTLSDPKFVSKSDHSLVFDADLEDSGDYECLATNELGTDSKTVSVEVLKQPTALINETDPIDAEYDEPLNITCEVLGYPKPDIVWTDVTNAAELEADVDEISHYRFISRLHIEKVTANAKYQCKANNTLGDGRHEVSVKTERKPHFNMSQNPEDKTYDIAYTTTTDFHCEADAYPAAEVNWYKNDRVLVSNENISVSSDGLVLTIKQMQLSDEGHYTCKVHNAYNSHEFPFEVRISGVAKPIISATSTEQNATESSDINFSCRIEQGIPKPTIRWLYQDTTSSDFNEVEGTSDQEVLSLKNVQRNNSGTYKCIATNFVDSDTMEFNLIVKYAPAVDDESAPVSVKTGAEVTLACSADGVPEPDVEWRKDNTTLSDPKFVSKSDHSLVFDADLEDSGDYECLATNELGTDSKTVSVEVLKQPTALINETDPIDAEYDEPLNITCEVLGYPKPDIVWTDVTNAAELEADVDEISHYRFISRLHIEKVTANAKYQCKANNTLGDGRHEVSVKTERKPHFNMSQNPEDKTYDIAYTTTTDFHCEADAYPAAEVNWYKNDRVLVSNENISVSSDGLVLTIKQMQLSDEGHYTCKVHNAYNSHEFPFEVRISGVAKPIISATSTEQNATESSDINFSCRIEQGIPKPTIRWLYQDTTSSDFNEVEGTSDQEVLSLKNVQRNNSGTYKCIATNFVDSDTMEFNLIVKYAPAVDDESAPVSVKTGAEVTLACSADGVPEPDVEWRKDNTTLSDPKFVSKSDHSLVFDADLEDSGDYECLATNELGTDSKTVSVEVLKQPTALINETDPIDAEYDEPLNITCEVLGYPKPDIVWTDVTNAAELEADVDEISHYRFISRLHIEKVTANAKYQCKANNTLGDGRHEVSVKTERKPHFNMSQNPEDKTYDIAYTTTTDFHCEADAYPAAEVNWYKNDRVLVSNENISVSSDGLVLTIKQMQLSDEGHYTCKVHNAYNSHEFPFEVRISGVAKPIISATSTEQNATESSDINFSCRIEQGIPKPTIRWLYQDTTSSDFNEVEGTSDQEVLSLKNVQRNNSGTYKCIATNFVDSDTVEFNLIVKYAPAVDDESAPVSVKTGAEVTLACSADGVPEPDVEWRKDNTTLSDPKFVSKSDHSLVFDADLEDSGDYECLATNELGTDSKTVSVEVLKQPTALINETDPIDAEYDEPLNITCEVLGYPKPDIVWTDVTNAAELEADVDEISHYRFISRLHIEKVTANAKYQCKANNTLGDGRHEVSVKTERKPHFNMSQNPEDKTYDIAYTTTTDFHCEADAYPAAEVNWYKNDRVLVSNENISVSSDGLVLTIKQMQLSDEGHYTCKVHNAYNSHEFPFEVRISGVAKPIISATSTEQNATESSDINFSCRIEQGIPKPTIRWLYQDTTSSDFNEVEGTSDQEVLSLKNVQRNNSGTYKCIATNFVDSDTVEFNLIVKYAPAVDDESAPVSVKTGAEVTLACSADGVPEPDVEWRKDNTTLSDPKFVSKSDHSLVFDADLEDSGDYECLATNELGTDSKTVSVEVLKQPTALINETDPIDAEYDEPLNITCEVLGYPKPDIVWTDVTNAAELEADVDEISHYRFISRLHIEKVTANAKYQCKANNTLGDGRHEVSVKTERKPHFNMSQNPEDKTYDIAYTTTTDFHCEADAYPAAEVNWYKNDRVLVSNENISVSSDGLVLTIKQMQLSDEGHYTCKVHNAYNSHEFPFEVRISGVAKPIISATSTEQNATESSDINFSCRIEQGIPKPTIRWLYQDTTSSDFNEVEGTSDQEVLSLKNVQRNNSGTYKCIATNFVDSDTMEFNLIVKYAPAVDDESAPVSVKTGAEVTLACSADGVPEPDVEWRKDNTTLSDPKFVSKSDHSLVFDAALEDSGDYECLATNELGTDSKTISVEVLKQPTALINETDPIDAEYDEPLNITCEVLGYPKPDIVWTDVTNAAELEADVDEISHYRFISRLHIEKVTANAKYQCKANNTLGDGRHEVSVKTERKPHFNMSQNPEDKTYDIAYTTTTDFHCEADAYPAAEVNWYKNDRVLVSNENISVSSDGLVLTIKQMQLSDEGHYTCKVHNAYNSHEFPFEVRISGVAKPIISATSTEQNATESSDINFSCRIEQGIPKPTIRWLYQDTTSSDFNEVEGTNDQEVLSLKNVQRNNSGTYKCIATNFVDSDAMEFNLIVKYAPAVDDESAPVSVKTGAEVTLACSADGVPEPDVEWRKDNTTLSDPKFVSKSDHSLVFDAALEDSGDYECLATNELGTDSKTISVEVLKQPTALINETDPIDAEYDEPLNITCEVLGYPKPDIVWTDVTNAAELEADVDEISHYRFISRLHIEKVTANAKYQCKANNTLGDGRHEVSVKTERKPHFNMSQNPEDKTYDVAYTTTTDFHCEADAYPAAEVNWYKNDRVLVSNENISVSSDGLVLTIKQMQLSDEGHYTCKVHNAYKSHEFPFEVKISGVVEPKISVTLNTLKVPVHSDTKFNCRIEAGIPFPSIRWYYKDVTNKFVEIENASDEDLILADIKIENEGTYKCVAENAIGHDEMEIDVIVEYAPNIDDVSETFTYVAGNLVTLKCSAHGYPPPKVEWKRDNTLLTGPKFVMSADHDLVFNGDLDDAGVFNCNASNKYGSAIKTVTIKVEIQPTVTINGDSKQRVDFNDDLDLKCNVIGNPPPVIWWTDVSNGAVLPSSTTTVKFPYEFHSVLSIKKAVNSAIYQCEAKNNHGSNKASVDIQVIRTNNFTVIEKPKDTVIAYNTEGKLFCKIDAYPLAKIDWYHKSKELKSEGDFKISTDGSVLTIAKMQPYQIGAYHCKASNGDKTEFYHASVTISGTVSPKLQQTNVYTVREGDSIYLHCKLKRGIPKPKITWLIWSKYVNRYVEIRGTTNQTHYLIRNVRREDITQYGCKAKNYLGSDSVIKTLQVQYPPTISDDETTYYVETNKEVAIPCSVLGIPEPRVTWTKSPSKIKLNSDKSTSLERKFRISDTGNYICTATNEHGTATRTVHIEVYKITISNKRKKKNQVINEFETLKLVCDAYGTPKPILEWFYEGTADNPKNESVDMPLDGIQYDQRGRYTCVASNSYGGRASYTYDVDVYTEVKIHNTEKIVEAVVGDMVLKIHCNATGNPKPYYIWRMDGAHNDENTDTISIWNVTKKYDSSYILCEARNSIDDLDNFLFEVLVRDSPTLNNTNTTIKATPGLIQTVACPIVHRTGEYLHWYKDGKMLPFTTQDIIIDPKPSDDGAIYICRASNTTGAETANVIIEVTTTLKFVNTSEATTLSLGFGETANLNCSAVGDPVPQTSWTFNGNRMESKNNIYTFNMKKDFEGKYECVVTSGYETVSRTFDVTLNECILKIDPNSYGNPLILSQHFTLPTYKYDSGSLYMPKHQSILLVCQNAVRINMRPYTHNYVRAYCNTTKNGVELLINGFPKSYSDVYCTQEVKPYVDWTHSYCFGEDSERLKIGFDVLHKTVEVYDICMDLLNDTPFYSKQNMQIPLAESVPSARWYNDRLRHNFDKFYDTNEQIRSLTNILGLPFHTNDRCVFSKLQLVNPLDVFPGLPQKTTFTHLNVVPHWSTCSTSNWKEVESRVRNLVQSTNRTLTVWTGRAEALKMNRKNRRTSESVDVFLSNSDDRSSQSIFTYIWKVVQDPVKASSVAIVQINIPDLTSRAAANYVKCSNVCREISWMAGYPWSNVSKGYVFCCYLSDFERAFRFIGHNIFGRGMNQLLR